MKKLILIGLLLTANHLYAAAAKVLYTQSKVVANHNNVARSISRGSSVEVGDEIVTAAGAAAHIQYSNGTLVNIGSDSKYKILAYSPSQKDNQISAELSKGRLETQNSGKIKETLKTPIVSLAILGTHLRVYASQANHPVGNKKNPKCAGNCASELTNVQVIEGLVSARDKLLKAGDSVRVSCDRIIDAPFPPEGIVASPMNAPGKIEAVTVSPIVDSGLGGQIGSQITTYVATNLDPGVSTNVGTQAIIATTSLAELSIMCFPAG